MLAIVEIEDLAQESNPFPKWIRDPEPLVQRLQGELKKLDEYWAKILMQQMQQWLREFPIP
jgi:hypothetical protein